MQKSGQEMVDATKVWSQVRGGKIERKRNRER